VVVNDLHVFRPGVGPTEADPPLPIDTDAVLPATVTGQLFQPIARRDQVLRLRSILYRGTTAALTNVDAQRY
jgi:hypothetical protein